jgi:hypothetical protein
VAVVHVADLEPCAIPRETARTEGVELTLVGKLRQWIGLIHELRQLRAAEELAHARYNRPNIRQRRWRGCGRIRDRHPFFDDPFHSEEAHAELVLD